MRIYHRPIAMLPVVVNLVYAITLVILAMTPSLPSLGREIPDYWAHGIAYGLQAAFAYWLVWPVFSHLGAAAVAWLAASVFGLSTEMAQAMSVARAAEMKDLGADMVGAGIVVLSLMVFRWIINFYRQFLSPMSIDRVHRQLRWEKPER